MMRRNLMQVMAAAALTLAGGTSQAAAGPVVVELFTSQGCSSCPPADANLIELSKRPDVLALSFGVTYWDYLGWEDTFARPEFTERQMVYEHPLGHAGAFTPQMVVDGRADAVGQDLDEIEDLIAQAAARQAAEPGPSISHKDGAVAIGSSAAPANTADIWLVRYDPRLSEVPVARGENRRRVLPITHVVRELTRLGSWSGESLALALPPAQAGLESAIIVQLPQGGPILAAAKL
ncbi:DUF1223 domain-containing protein [Dongia sp.]|uniref:DUF1223 domain-containing protein n=1 Tax=Dongia sp. TaxID=1977262 RepID=UPI0035B3DAC3